MENPRQFTRKLDWLYYLVLILLVVLIFWPMFYSQTVTKYAIEINDFKSHIKLASILAEGLNKVPRDLLPISVWQVLVLGINLLTQVKFRIAGMLAAIYSMIMSAVIVYRWIAPVLQRKGMSLWWGVFLAIALNLMAPIALLALLDKKFYVGYIGIITYHNPTILLLYPLALLQFMYAVKCFDETPISWGATLFAALVSILANFTKPNYSICLIPAMGLMTAYYLFKRQRLNWKLLIFGFGLPLFLTLAVQFLAVYQGNDSRSIIFYPGGAMTLFSRFLAEKALLSFVFPLLVAIFYFGQARRDPRMLLAWLSFLFGIFYSYFVAESGLHFRDGNFTWSGQITLFVLFCLSTLFYLENQRLNQLKDWQLKLSWGLHLAFGVLYYFYCLLGNIYY